jgi:hypothetical protein
MALDLTDTQLSAMKHFYEAELQQTVAKLRHLQDVLSKIDGNTHVQINVVEERGSGLPTSRIALGDDSPSKRTRKKKRGRKSIWGEFILQTLKSTERPLLYSEIIQAAKVRFNVPDSKKVALKAAINQSAFRLRTIHKKIETVGEEGKKERYMALLTWYEDGKLSPQYSKYIK